MFLFEHDLNFSFVQAFNPLHNDRFLDSKLQVWLKEFADDKFKLDKNGGKFSELVENSVGKVEIAHYEQFLLFPQWFQKTCMADT